MLAFTMTWLMEILKIYLEEQLLKNYCVIKHLMSLNIVDSYQQGITPIIRKVVK